MTTTNTTTYEYAHTTVANNMASITSDAYETLGWELVSTESANSGTCAKLSFRRPQKVADRSRVVTLQHSFDGFGCSTRFAHI